MSGCSFSWDDIKPNNSGLSNKQCIELNNAKKDKSNLENRLKQMSSSEKLADLKLRCALKASQRFTSVVTNAIDKIMTLEESADDLGL